ncbi:hypothetical protein RQN30_09205 [Arcanobacterium hippocoleae]
MAKWLEAQELAPIMYKPDYFRIILIRVISIHAEIAEAAQI